MAIEYHIYDRRFFQNTKEFEGASAQAAARILIEHFKPRSVADIGAGCGIYLKEFEAAGLEIFGLDGSPAALEESLVRDKIKIHDLAESFVWMKKYDLAICFEVAEHLPAEDADTLIKTITGASDLIAFTAATPGQGPREIGHINEQPPEYWIEKFKEQGFALDEPATEKIKKEFADRGVVWWLEKNFLLFRKK